MFDRHLAVGQKAAAAAVLACSAPFTLVNPYGVGLWQFLWSTVGLGRADITEWWSVAQSGAGVFLFWAVTATLAVVVARASGGAPHRSRGRTRLRVVPREPPRRLLRHRHDDDVWPVVRRAGRVPRLLSTAGWHRQSRWASCSSRSPARCRAAASLIKRRVPRASVVVAGPALHRLRRREPPRGQNPGVLQLG